MSIEKTEYQKRIISLVESILDVLDLGYPAEPPVYEFDDISYIEQIDKISDLLENYYNKVY